MKLMFKIGYIPKNPSNLYYGAGSFVIDRCRVRKFLQSYNIPELENIEYVMFENVTITYKSAKDKETKNPISEIEMINIKNLLNFNGIPEYTQEDLNYPKQYNTLNNNTNEYYNLYCRYLNMLIDLNNYNSILNKFYIVVAPVVHMKVKKSENKEFRQFITSTEYHEKNTTKKSNNDQSRKSQDDNDRDVNKLILDNRIMSSNVNHTYVAKSKYIPMISKKSSETIRVVALDDSCIFSDKADPLIFLMTYLTYPYLFHRILFEVYDKTSVNTSVVVPYVQYLSCASLNYVYGTGYSITYVILDLIDPRCLIKINDIYICRDMENKYIKENNNLLNLLIKGNNLPLNIIKNIESSIGKYIDNPTVCQAIYLDCDELLQIYNNTKELNCLLDMRSILIDDFNYQYNRDFFIILPPNKKLINNKLYDL